MRRSMSVVLCSLLVAAFPSAAIAVIPEPQSVAPACADAPAGRFTDVSGTHADSIDCIGWWGVTQGTGDRSYEPNGAVRRDQMASFVARTLELTGGTLPSSPPNAFTDDNGNTHERPINQLAALGVVGGVSATSYAPGRTVTRAQMASFLSRAWEARVGAPLPTGEDLFGDDDGDTHEDNINRVAAAGLTGGTSGGGYAPTTPVTRGQMGTFLARLLAKMVADGHITYPPSNPVAMPEPEPGDGTREDPLGQGVAFDVGDWEVTIIDTNPDATEQVLAENQFNEITEGRQPVMAEVSATYTGSDSGLAWLDLEFRYVTADGNTFGSSFDDYCGVIPDALDDTGETFEGGTVDGNVCVQVPSTKVEDGLWMVDDMVTFQGDRTFVRAE